jgi:hypothetical protein
MPKVIRSSQLGGPEVPHIEDQPTRQPGPGEVQLKVQAVGLTRLVRMAVAALLPLDFAYCCDTLRRGSGPGIPQGRFQISMACILHCRARVDLVPKPSCDARSPEFVEFDFGAAALTLQTSDAVRAPAAFDPSPSRQALQHLQ